MPHRARRGRGDPRGGAPMMHELPDMGALALAEWRAGCPDLLRRERESIEREPYAVLSRWAASRCPARRIVAIRELQRRRTLTRAWSAAIGGAR